MMLQTMIAVAIVVAAALWLVIRYVRRSAAAKSAASSPCTTGGSSGGECGSCSMAQGSTSPAGLITAESLRNGKVPGSQA